MDEKPGTQKNPARPILSEGQHWYRLGPLQRSHVAAFRGRLCKVWTLAVTGRRRRFAGPAKSRTALASQTQRTLGIQVFYDPPPHPLTRGQLSRTYCYDSGLLIASLREPLTGGYDYPSDQGRMTTSTCPDPYDISSPKWMNSTKVPSIHSVGSACPWGVLSYRWMPAVVRLRGGHHRQAGRRRGGGRAQQQAAQVSEGGQGEAGPRALGPLPHHRQHRLPAPRGRGLRAAPLRRAGNAVLDGLGGGRDGLLPAQRLQHGVRGAAAEAG